MILKEVVDHIQRRKKFVEAYLKDLLRSFDTLNEKNSVRGGRTFSEQDVVQAEKMSD